MFYLKKEKLKKGLLIGFHEFYFLILSILKTSSLFLDVLLPVVEVCFTLRRNTEDVLLIAFQEIETQGNDQHNQVMTNTLHHHTHPAPR